ncbi:MAG TPA: hypothetical protein VLA96_14590 [Terriglobales bacterium]|nr:hypothetical protein [Terriglobales bacterium]
MPRRVLVLTLLLATSVPAAARDHEAQQRAAVRAALQEYLDAGFRGAPWNETAPLVLWEQDQESDCLGVVRSFNITGVRLRDKRNAVGTVMFYRLGEYCEAQQTFTPRPGLEEVVYQLRKKSISWLVEKSNRPGANVDWQVLREQLKRRLSDPALPVADTAKLADALSKLEKTAAAIGKTPAEAISNKR